jgi:twinkle protein
LAESELVEKNLPCLKCGSSDGVAHYDDGHSFCFVCRYLTPAAGVSPIRKEPSRMDASQAVLDAIATGTPKALPVRKLTQETCRKWGYLSRNTGAGWQQMAVYRTPMGAPVGIKLRSEDKQFSWIGDDGGQLFGRHLWGSGGKMVVVTEGEIDAMSVSQAQDHAWPVVSLPNGAGGAAKAIAKNIEWLCTFDKVLIGGDMDAPGRKACQEAAAMLPAGKAYIIKWTSKDPNAMLQEGRQADITRCIWQAEAYRPDGILDARTISLKVPEMGTPWAHTAMTNWSLGRRNGELYTFGAGTGLGKSDFLAEQIAATINGANREGLEFQAEGFAVFGYEAGPATTKMQIAGKLAKRRFQFPQGHPDCMWEPEELASVIADMDGPIWNKGGRLFILDSKGAADWEAVKDHCRFLRRAEGITNFLVDPIGALVVDEDEERKFLDRATLEASQLSVELDTKVYFVSHLTRPKDGPSHEEGGHVRLSQFRGSNGVGMYSSFVFGLERNQQADTATERCTTTVRAVKDRLTGNSTGETFELFYDRISGTLDPANNGITPEDEALI